MIFAVSENVVVLAAVDVAKMKARRDPCFFDGVKGGCAAV